jgi:dUTP pyrophosphatase
MAKPPSPPTSQAVDEYQPILKIKLMDHAPGMPEYKTDGSVGFDIMSAVSETIPSRGRKLIETGICLEVPPGFEVQIRSRSGLAANNGVFVLNSPGTVDQDYRGEVIIVLQNIGYEVMEVTRGMRIAQGVLVPVIRPMLQQVDELSPTERGAGRFGSTGK